jgi:hypothetical protein
VGILPAGRRAPTESASERLMDTIAKDMEMKRRPQIEGQMGGSRVSDKIN